MYKNQKHNKINQSRNNKMGNLNKRINGQKMTLNQMA